MPIQTCLFIHPCSCHVPVWTLGHFRPANDMWFQLMTAFRGRLSSQQNTTDRTVVPNTRRQISRDRQITSLKFNEIFMCRLAFSLPGHNNPDTHTESGGEGSACACNTWCMINGAAVKSDLGYGMWDLWHWALSLSISSTFVKYSKQKLKLKIA